MYIYKHDKNHLTTYTHTFIYLAYKNKCDKQPKKCQFAKNHVNLS